MARVVQITIDALDPHRQAAWWAGVLGYTVEDGHEFVSGLLAGGAIGEADVVSVEGRLQFATVAAASDPARLAPRLHFQRVSDPKASRNRVHLDVPVAADRLDAEVERLCGLGGELVQFKTRDGQRWANMRDPEGNEFCLQ